MKYINNIIYSLIACCILFTSCDPMEDVYAELDRDKSNGEHPDVVVDLKETLDAEDYKQIADMFDVSAIKERGAVFSEEQASAYIPAMLNATYTGPDTKSSCLVSFELAVPMHPDFDALNASLDHVVSESEYASISKASGAIKALLPGTDPAVALPPLLKALNSTLPTGTTALVNYNVSTSEEVVPVTKLVDEEFETDLGALKTVSIVGEKEWFKDDFGGVTYAKMSSYDKGLEQGIVNEDWLLTSVLDLSTFTKIDFQFSQAINHIKGNYDFLSVLISTDFNSDVSSATWTTLNVPNMPTEDSYDYYESGIISLDAYAGQTITIAFKYTSTKEIAPTWQIDNILIEAQEESSNAGEINEELSYFRFDGANWDLMEEVHVLQENDYAEMGDPGKSNRFSKDLSPDFYLPIFIGKKFIYKKEGDTQLIAYNYYDGEATVDQVSEYKLVEGSWENVSNLSTTISKQYLRGEVSWMFDPTITFSMTSDDFMSIVNYVKENKESTYSEYDNSEYYYGASAKYTNFDLRLSKRIEAGVPAYKDISTEARKDLIYERMYEALGIMLANKFPNASTQVSGVDSYYNVDFWIFDGAKSNLEARFKCTKSAPDAEFELIYVRKKGEVDASKYIYPTPEK